MSIPLEISDTNTLQPKNPFLQCERADGHNPNERALESPLFTFASTDHTLGARLITVPPDRAFARHTHPNAYHFIYVIEGTGIMEYDHQIFTLKAGQTCLVCKGVPHKLGAGKEGLRAIVVNSPTYDNGDPEHVHYLEDETLESDETHSHSHAHP